MPVLSPENILRTIENLHLSDLQLLGLVVFSYVHLLERFAKLQSITINNDGQKEEYYFSDDEKKERRNILQGAFLRAIQSIQTYQNIQAVELAYSIITSEGEVHKGSGEASISENFLSFSELQTADLAFGDFNQERKGQEINKEEFPILMMVYYLTAFLA